MNSKYKILRTFAKLAETFGLAIVIVAGIIGALFGLVIVKNFVAATIAGLVGVLNGAVIVVIGQLILVFVEQRDIQHEILQSVKDQKF